MARSRQLLIVFAAVLVLAGCGRPAPSAQAPVPASVGKANPPAAAPKQVRVAPEWRSRLPEIDLGRIPTTMRQASDALDRGQLERGTSPGPGALELYLAVLGLDAENPEALAGVHSTLDALLERGRLAMRSGKLADAERIELIARSLMPEHPDLMIFQKHLADARLAERWVAKANAEARAGRFTAPTGSSALDYFNRARQAFADFDPVTVGLNRCNREVLNRAWKAASAEEFAAADAYLLQSARLLPSGVEARVLGLRIVELRQARTDAVLAEGNAEVDKLRLYKADAALAHAERVAAQQAGVAALRRRIHLARHYGPFMPGQLFSEKLAAGGVAPEMVVIAYGQFLMGSPEIEAQRQDNEMPAHTVKFRRGFAIARNETTVAEFGRFVAASHYRSWATRNGHSTVYDEKGGVFSEHEGVDWRRDHVGRIASPTLPVVHVTVQDALAYARWLSTQTRQHYRLPSEAEFEYVLRGGSRQLYPWGAAPPKRIVGNLPGDGDLSRLGRRWGNSIPGYRDAFWGPSPVRNFPPEALGTFDMIGNVSEWTLDCWHDSYQRAPMDGSAWVNAGCPQRVVRGASWGSSLDQARSASRLPMAAEASTAQLGFRVARDL